MLFSKLFHTQSKILPFIDHGNIPLAWKTTYYKKYPRLPSIALTVHEAPPQDLFQMLGKRASSREYQSIPMSGEEISLLLQYACGERGATKGDARVKRTYPSGGGRYSIEVYPLILHGTSEIPAGLYHYDVENHALDVLYKKEFTEEELKEYFLSTWIGTASMVLLLTSVFHRTQDKYKERGYRLLLLEAGHIGQNITLMSEALKLKCCPFAGTDDEEVEKLIDIDGVHEALVYALAVGH